MNFSGSNINLGGYDAVGQLKDMSISPSGDAVIENVEFDFEDEGEKELEEEEEEEDVGEVILGFADKPKNSWSLLRQYFPSKAGGTPAWLNPIDIPTGRSMMCDICEQPLHFLLQVYAPISEDESDSAFHRSLFLFMCTSMSCLLRDQHEQWNRGHGMPSRSVKVFRSQLHLVNPFYSSNPPIDGATKPTVSGVPLCSWCGTWKGDKMCGSCRKARYCSPKHQGMHWRCGHKVDCQGSSLLSPPDVKRHSAETFKAACNTLWPEYELRQTPESEFDAEMSDDVVSSNSIVDLGKKRDESMVSLFNSFQADEEKQCWVSFQDRIARSPEQVLRYCREKGARPLWPMISGRPSNADIPKCRYCGGQLQFEFQIMPQLLYYLGVKNDTDSLDWATIVIYTCESSCAAGGIHGEEFPWVQLWSQSSSS